MNNQLLRHIIILSLFLYVVIMYFGVDYYPEQWDYSLINEDLNRIANSELNCIRIAEFAWHLIGAYRK